MGAPRDPVLEAWNRLVAVAAREAVRLILGVNVTSRTNQGPQRLSAYGNTANLRAYATLGVLSSAPRAVIEAAYRALAKEAHPDAGGSPDRMRDLNAAIETIRKERRWKA
jgi:DnaJ-domain-containing protein 1